MWLGSQNAPATRTFKSIPLQKCLTFYTPFMTFDVITSFIRRFMGFILMTDIFTIKSQLTIFQILSTTNSQNSFDSDLLKSAALVSDLTFGFNSHQQNIIYLHLISSIQIKKLLTLNNLQNLNLGDILTGKIVTSRYYMQ